MPREAACPYCSHTKLGRISDNYTCSKCGRAFSHLTARFAYDLIVATKGLQAALLQIRNKYPLRCV